MKFKTEMISVKKIKVIRNVREMSFFRICISTYYKKLQIYIFSKI